MVKSAYEAALEKLEKAGVARPDSQAVSEEMRQAMEEIRARARARLAELEILHARSLQGVRDPQQIRDLEDGYLRERRRAEDQRERELDALRTSNRPTES